MINFSRLLSLLVGFVYFYAWLSWAIFLEQLIYFSLTEPRKVSSFFMVSIFCFLSAYKSNPKWLLPPLLFLGFAGLFRLIGSFMLQGHSLDIPAFSSEFLFFLILAFSFFLMKRAVSNQH